MELNCRIYTNKREFKHTSDSDLIFSVCLLLFFSPSLMVMGKYSLDIVVKYLNLKIKHILVEDSFFIVHFIFR